MNITGAMLFSLVRARIRGAFMTGNHGLAFSVSEAGIFIHFIASDGSETQIDALSVLDCSNAMTNKPLLHWYHERLEEVSPNEMPDELRWDLLSSLDEIAAAKEAELADAQDAGAKLLVESGDPLVQVREYLHRTEQVADAASVLLTREAFEALLELAKRGAS